VCLDWVLFLFPSQKSWRVIRQTIPQMAGIIKIMSWRRITQCLRFGRPTLPRSASKLGLKWWARRCVTQIVRIIGVTRRILSSGVVRAKKAIGSRRRNARFRSIQRLTTMSFRRSGSCKTAHRLVDSNVLPLTDLSRPLLHSSFRLFVL
jgi:hypothetical protein